MTEDFKDFNILEKYSSYSKLCKIIAYCLRFRPTNKYNGPLCVKEINEAESRILKLFQSVQFANEFKRLKDKQPIHKSKIASLHPFIDKDGLIRVGGRLKSSNLTYAQKHPVLIPSRHHLIDLIIRETHERQYHAGIQTTPYTIRQKFWLLNDRNQVKKIIRKCIRCTRFDPTAVEYKMADLPPNRVREVISFSHVGVDFCGPFYVKEKKYRNRN